MTPAIPSARASPPQAAVRLLARHQWVRLLGTPRVTVLAGGARARALWQDWARVAHPGATLLEAETGAELTPQLRRAVDRAAAAPGEAIAVRAPLAVLEAWRSERRDRLGAMVDEGLIRVEDLDGPDDVSAPPPRAPARASAARARGARAPALPLAARSAAEAAMFEALEATAATAGRFELNGRLAVRFGGTAAEVDLLSRQDRIAIEIDGLHHFGDVECFRRDRRKDLLLQTQGLVVVRLLAEDVLRDARVAVRAVCEALAYRRTEDKAAAPRAARPASGNAETHADVGRALGRSDRVAPVAPARPGAPRSRRRP